MLGQRLVKLCHFSANWLLTKMVFPSIRPNAVDEHQTLWVMKLYFGNGHDRQNKRACYKHALCWIIYIECVLLRLHGGF